MANTPEVNIEMVNPEVVIATPNQQAQNAKESETALHTEGQRATSLVWEGTQMKLALMTVGGFLASELFVVAVLTLILIKNWTSLSDNPTAIAVLVAVLTASLGAIASTASLVIGFYFGRTNHQRVGGVGGDSAGER